MTYIQIWDSLPRHSKCFQQALTIYRDLGQRREGGTVLNSIGRAYVNQNQIPQALTILQQALEIHRDIGNLQGEGLTLGYLGVAYFKQGDLSTAQESVQHALTIHRNVGNRRGEGICLAISELDSYAARETDHRVHAGLTACANHLERARETAPGWESAVLISLGETYVDLGQPDSARDVLQQAVWSARETWRPPHSWYCSTPSDTA